MKNRIPIGTVTSNVPDDLHKLNRVQNVTYDGPTDHGHQFSVHKMTAVDSVHIQALQKAVRPKTLTFSHNSLGDLVLHVEQNNHHIQWAIFGLLVTTAAAIATQDVLKEFASRLAELWPY